MNTGSRKWPAFAVAIVFVILAGAAVILARYRIYIPYYWEMIVAPRSSSPVEAYEAFYEALKLGETDQALRYLSREERAAFKTALRNDPALAERQVGHKSALRELHTADCDQENICRKFAVYEYDYEVAQSYTEHIGSYEFAVKPGTQVLEMRFIQLPGGAWQISQL